MKMERMILIAAMVVVTFIPRAIPAALIERMRFPKKVEKFLNLIPYTAMASLIFPGILTVDGSNVLIGLLGDHGKAGNPSRSCYSPQIAAGKKPLPRSCKRLKAEENLHSMDGENG